MSISGEVRDSMGIFRWIAGNHAWLTVALAAVAIVAVLVMIWFFPEQIAAHFGLPEDKRLDIVRTYLLAVGGLLLIWQVFIANRRASSAERIAELTALGNITERLDSAIEHLASDNPIVRIVALYQLHHIALDAPEYRVTVLDMFRAHLEGILVSVSDVTKLTGQLHREHTTVSRMVRELL